MKSVHKSVLIWHSAHEMFSLVTDVAQYPRFLPWCDRAAVLEHTPDGVVAQVGISIGGLRQSFTTRNSHVPDERVDLRLVDGPFSRLQGHWRFQPLGDGTQRAPSTRPGCADDQRSPTPRRVNADPAAASGSAARGR